MPLGGVETGWTLEECEDAEVDRDLDRLADGCEFALAAAFAPVLRIEAGVCGWSSTADPPRPRGGYLFGVHPADGVTVRIAFLPAYSRDCGWSGPKCAFLRPMCEGHTGDSEMIALQVANLGGERWGAEAVFLSAHCFGDRSCRWYSGGDLDRLEWLDGRIGGVPVVWVARGTNANYPSRSRCDRGHFSMDSCDRNETKVRFPVVSDDQNVGSRSRPFLGRAPSGCVALNALPWRNEDVDAEARECFWSDEPFRGWTRPAVGDPPTPYFVYLHSVVGF